MQMLLKALYTIFSASLISYQIQVNSLPFTSRVWSLNVVQGYKNKQ